MKKLLSFLGTITLISTPIVALTAFSKIINNEHNSNKVNKQLLTNSEQSNKTYSLKKGLNNKKTNSKYLNDKNLDKSDKKGFFKSNSLICPTSCSDFLCKWKQNGITEILNSAWEGHNGLTPSLYSDVNYIPVNIIKNQAILVKKILPQLGFTKDNPWYFYVEGY